MSTVNRQYLILHTIIITLLIASGCNNHQNKYIYKWPLIGEPFDSLIDRLEWQFNDFAPFDSIDQTILRLKDAAEKADNAVKQTAASRVLYWKARYLGRQQKNDSALNVIKKALALNDSSNYYYDRLRIMTEWYSDNDLTNGADQYRHFETVSKYSREINDKAYEAHNSIMMGNLLSSIGEYEKGLYCLSYGDSLYQEAGFTKLPIKNRINRATIIGNMGDRKGEDSIMKTLFGNPALKGDTFAINLVSRNLWSATNEKSYLLKAYNEIKESDNYQHLRGLYNALLATQNYKEGNFDSTIYYTNLAMEDLPHVKEYGHKAIIWHSASIAWRICNRLDSAFICRIRYEKYIDSARMKQQTTEVFRLSALHEMGMKEAEYAASIKQRNILMVLVIVVLIGGTILTWSLINRRNMRLRMIAMKNELELEKAKRKIAATTLSIEEKDNMLTAIRSELSEMRQEGEIKERSARKLESTIKAHLLESDNEETFRKMFDVVNPGFTERLRERCPGLADSYVKLASYVLMELDNKRIASLMMIKPESVHQARWRLRQRLNIPADQSIRDFLNDLNKKI